MKENEVRKLRQNNQLNDRMVTTFRDLLLYVVFLFLLLFLSNTGDSQAAFYQNRGAKQLFMLHNRTAVSTVKIINSCESRPVVSQQSVEHMIGHAQLRGRPKE